MRRIPLYVFHLMLLLHNSMIACSLPVTICAYVFVNVNSKQGNVAVGCLYSIVASFIGLCGAACVYVCNLDYVYVCTMFCWFFFFFSSLHSVRVLSIHNKSSRMLSVKIHISLLSERTIHENWTEQLNKKTNITFTHTHILTQPPIHSHHQRRLTASAVRSIQSHRIFSVQFCLVRCRVIVNLWVFAFARTPLHEYYKKQSLQNYYNKSNHNWRCI